MIVTIIGRGHSGTRAIAHTLQRSGFYMGRRVNESGDYVPRGKPIDFYRACGILGDYVDYLGNYEWDFSRVVDADPSDEFINTVKMYLSSILDSGHDLTAWKLPESIFAFPWLVKVFPDFKYVYLIRNPNDSILGGHLSDDLSFFNVPLNGEDFPFKVSKWNAILHGESTLKQRAISWKYQRDIYQASPDPRNLIEIKFEDFIINQEYTLVRLSAFLGLPLVKIPVDEQSVGRWNRKFKDKCEACEIIRDYRYD